jgi:glucose-1-phosphate adenylyltransferase
MRGNNVVGLLFSNVHDERIRELTEKRAMASVPFGGRYRLIDFILSSMVNCGINKVGVITKSNYQSLMDHLGSGKAWDLSRKREGLYMLPPFGEQSSISNSRIDALSSSSRFLTSSKEDYVLLSNCDMVCNIDFKQVISFHLKKQADITVVYRFGKIPDKMSNTGVFEIDPDGRVRDMLIDPKVEGECNYGLNIILIRRELLIKLVADCVSRNLYDLERDLLQRNIGDYQVYAYEFQGFLQTITSANSYFEANMALMLPQVRAQLFNPERPVYTKVRDDMPARYGLGSNVSNSLVADGCQVEGEVENCVLFRGVRVDKGAKLRNCVIMQDSDIGAGTRLSYVITDKNVVIKADRSLMGFQSYPVFISKGSIV